MRRSDLVQTETKGSTPRTTQIVFGERQHLLRVLDSLETTQVPQVRLNQERRVIEELIHEDLRRARMHYGPFYLLSSIQLADIGYDQDFFVPTSDTSSGFSFGISAVYRPACIRGNGDHVTCASARSAGSLRVG